MSFNKLLEESQKVFPNLKIKFKDQSLLMKIMNKILFFSKDFMTGYTTTIGETIYFPNEEYIKNKETSAMIVLLHELVHIKDSQKYSKLLFTILYLSPQIFSILCLPLFLISWKIALPLFIFFMLPLPSYFRMYFEKRAYIVSLYCINKLSEKLNFKPLLATQQIFFMKQFNGSMYYFMWIFSLNKEFNEAVELIKANKKPFNDSIFNIVDDLITKI